MNSQEAFRRFAQQVQRAGSQGGGGGGFPGRFFAGGGLLAALIGGGVLLNASLFNGASCHSSQLSRKSCRNGLKLTAVTVPSSIRGRSNKLTRELSTHSALFSLHGVKDQVYNEGTHLMVCVLHRIVLRGHSIISGTMARDTNCF